MIKTPNSILHKKFNTCFSEKKFQIKVEVLYSGYLIQQSGYGKLSLKPNGTIVKTELSVR